MELFSELYNMDDTIESNMESLYNFRYYRYCNQIGEQDEYAATDLFHPNIQCVRAITDNKYSHKFVGHLPQNVLVKLLSKKLKELNLPIHYNHELIKAINASNCVRLDLYDHKEKRTLVEDFDFVVACDGFHSRLRTIADIGLSSTQHKMTFLNIHFKSKDLARSLIKLKRNGMLHFVYNSKVILKDRWLFG